MVLLLNFNGREEKIASSLGGWSGGGIRCHEMNV